MRTSCFGRRPALLALLLLVLVAPLPVAAQAPAHVDSLAPQEWVRQFLASGGPGGRAYEHPLAPFHAASPCPTPGDQHDRLIDAFVTSEVPDDMLIVVVSGLSVVDEVCGDRRARDWIHARFEEKVRGGSRWAQTFLGELGNHPSPERAAFLIGLIRSGAHQVNPPPVVIGTHGGFDVRFEDLMVGTIVHQLDPPGRRDWYFEVAGRGLLTRKSESFLLKSIIWLNGQTFLGEMAAEIERRPELILDNPAQPLVDMALWFAPPYDLSLPYRPDARALIRAVLKARDRRPDLADPQEQQALAKLEAELRRRSRSR
jgi:hypothetical protein